MAQFPPDFADAFLQLHNQYRETHNSPPLEIIDELSESAQEWADQLAVQGVPVYKSDPEYGENIFAGFLRGAPENVKPEDPLELWYREGRYFKYGEETVKNTEDVRHFTQLVWKGTTSMGIGMAIGGDGETYIVCFYQPPGNVPDGYAENVLSPFEGGDAELLPHEAAEIKAIEIPPKVVASMQRLYAVPSEKLRVWSAWLTKIGEITDEWQKWLRSNIDLAIRIGEHLEAAEEALRKSKMADEDKADKDKADEDLAGEGKKEAVSQSVEADLEDKALGSKSLATMKTAASSMITVHGSKPSVQQAPSTSAISRSEEMPIWPLGVPWQPAEEEKEEPEEEILEKLPIPRNEEEMKEYLKKFKTDAVMYRSYYKHWRETADQTMSEVGGRYVMATFLVQGRREEALKRIANQQKRVEAAEKAKRLVSKTKPTSSIMSGSPSGSSLYVTAPQSVASEAPETSEPPEADKATEDSEEPEKPAEQPKVSSSKLSKSASAVETTPSKSEVERDEALDVDEVFRDNARANEPIPYHFYLRAEPDVDLAGVEDENDEILEVDLTRAEMIGTLKRLWYNIAEKPCKSGKPWI
ncbi:uncharacterized protein LOC143211491 isoform X2 [Lasioglossum baleicum]|uniref:uncharacterized protein LOC143211491 isoform X2 n=1 Tax=Lasioglossum baleicum TaxID=434251 RepID=UPI003FCE2483